MHNYALQYLENQSNYSYVSACDAKAKEKKNTWCHIADLMMLQYQHWNGPN